MPLPSDSRPTRARLGWIDAARGSCVLAVVLFHVISWHLPALDVAPGAERVLEPVTSYLGSLRMPLLLAVSGMLAGPRVMAGFRRSGARMPFAAERTGNVAFDDWREGELKRLDEERLRLNEASAEFESYARELRRAKDQEEFDRFMSDRARNRRGAEVVDAEMVHAR